jgi:hypothetical protein
VATIAKEARLSEREVQRAIPILEKIGELEVFRSKGPNGAHYFVMRKMKKTHCWYCGSELHHEIAAQTIDHQTPTSKGGKDELFNLVYSCLPCNHEKGDRNLEEYRVFKKAGSFYGETFEGCQNVTRPQFNGRQIRQDGVTKIRGGVTNPTKKLPEMSPEPSEPSLTVLKDKERMELLKLAIQETEKDKSKNKRSAEERYKQHIEEAVARKLSVPVTVPVF